MKLNRYSYIDKRLEKRFGLIGHKYLNGICVFSPKEVKDRIKVHFRLESQRHKYYNDDLPF